MPSALSADDRCARLAARNHQILSREEALRAGLSPRAIGSRVGSGRWRIVYPNAYFIGQGAATWKSRVAAAVAWAGEGAVASHASAAQLLGFGASTQAVCITSARRINSRHGIEVHWDPDLAAEARVRAENIRVTPADRTIVDLCARMSRPEAVALIERAVRSGRVTLDKLARRAELPGVSGRRAAGTATLQWALQHRFALGVTDSELENMFIRLARKHRLPAVHHHVVYDGSRRVAELDFAYLDAKVNVELDGDAFHADAVSVAADKERDAHLAALGWVVIRVTYWQLVHEPEAVFDRIRRAVESRRTQGRLPR
jgi:very-short-patch-repair endonuclease